MSNHAVSSCQVPVHKLLGIQVCHAISNFCCHLNHLLQGRGRTAWVILKSKHGSQLALCFHLNYLLQGKGTVAKVTKSKYGFAFSRLGTLKSRCPSRDLEEAHFGIWAQGTEVTLQVSMSHQFHHDQCWLAFGHHPKEANLQDKHGSDSKSMKVTQRGSSIISTCHELSVWCPQHTGYSMPGSTASPSMGKQTDPLMYSTSQQILPA